MNKRIIQNELPVIPVESEEPSFVEIDDEARTITISGVIEDETVGGVMTIVDWNRKDKDIDIDQRQPITVYLDTVGGDMGASRTIVDLINLSKTPIRVIGVNKVQSGGSLIMALSPKGSRYIMKNACVLIHDGETCIHATTEKFMSLSKFFQERRRKYMKEFSEATGIPVSTLRSKSKEEWYMTGEEAVAYGIADYVIDDISMMF